MKHCLYLLSLVCAFALGGLTFGARGGNVVAGNTVAMKMPPPMVNTKASMPSPIARRIRFLSNIVVLPPISNQVVRSE